MPESPGNHPPRDLDWIKQSLQAAIELEFSTLPLYLSAMFSLEVQNYTAYNLIRSIAMEEMVHMAIVANLLTALGGVPRFKGIKISFPTRGLPGGAEPDLQAGLCQFSKNQLKNFMRIEMPDVLVGQLGRGEEYPTISAFYRSIRDAVGRNAEAVRAAVKTGGPANQVGDDIGFTTITDQPGVDIIATIDAAFDEIMDQGEGGSDSLIASAAYQNEESHYARFAELYYGANFSPPDPPVALSVETEALFFKGRPIAWPEVINTLAVPSDGYARILALDPNASAVLVDLVAFDTAFSNILAALDDAWNGPAAVSWKTLGGAVHGMVDLRVLSCFNLIRHQIPSALVAQLPGLYPEEIEYLRAYTDFAKPVCYGPRFLNTNPTA